MMIETLRAVNDTKPRPINSLAGAIIGAIKVDGVVHVTAVGPEACYNALRSIIKAEEMLRRDAGWENIRIRVHHEMMRDRNKENFMYVRFRCEGVRGR